jgi:hypothetical protein
MGIAYGKWLLSIKVASVVDKLWFGHGVELKTFKKLKAKKGGSKGGPKFAISGVWIPATNLPFQLKAKIQKISIFLRAHHQLISWDVP